MRIRRGKWIHLILMAVVICLHLYPLQVEAEDQAVAKPKHIAIEACHYQQGDHAATLTFLVSSEPDFKVFSLTNPSRLVVDLQAATWQATLPLVDSHSMIQAIRQGVHEDKIRVVLDLNTKMILNEAYVRQKESSRFELVLELKQTDYQVNDAILDRDIDALDELAASFLADDPSALQTATSKNNKTEAEAGTGTGTETSAEAEAAPMELAEDATPADKHFVPIPIRKPGAVKEELPPYQPLIILDAGHGGHDPGAVGYKGTKEKNVTINMALELKQALLDTKRYRVLLTRTGDYYVKLPDRVRIAMKQKGDLFISLHADSHPDRSTKGLSVYSLSEKASDKEAAMLAKRANEADKTYGMAFDADDQHVTDILIDLVKRDMTNQSALFAEIAVTELRKNINTLRNAHRFAGFRVLKSADIPSVLIELGYMTNRKEEALLNTKEYRATITNALIRAIDRYYNDQENSKTP